MDALERKSKKSSLAIGMYNEAIRALDRMDGPEALPVAAYELREFMNILPTVLDVPVVPHGQLKDKVQAIVTQWRGRTEASACLKNGKWGGEIDDHLKRGLKAVEDFAKWVETQQPARRVETSAMLKNLLPTEHPMPVPLLMIRVKEWSALLGYFNSIAHHDSVAEVVEFEGRVERLETFLLDHLVPRTFEDQDEIDRLIREAESPQ